MATQTDDGTQTSEDQTFELRRTVASAYAAVQGQQATQSFASFSFEDAVDAQIERISGADTPARPNLLNRIAKTKNDMVNVAAQIKKLPPELFNKPDPTTDVNTPPEGADV